MRYYLSSEGEQKSLDLIQTTRVHGDLFIFDFRENEQGSCFRYWVRNLAGRYFISPDGKTWKKMIRCPGLSSLLVANRVFDIFRGYLPSGLGHSDDGALVSKMPGKIAALQVAEGQSVEAGETLLVIEAMKMENELKAAGAGRVKAVHVKVGQAVESGLLLLELEIDSN